MTPELDMNDVYQALAIPPLNQNPYRIRRMYETDIETVVGLERITWPTEPWSSEDFFQVLNEPDWDCWILEYVNTDHLVFGYGLQCLNDGVRHIANLCIHPDRRGCGLGGMLLRHMINYVRQFNASAVTLEVHTSNSQAYRLYVNHGFRIVRILRQYYFDHSDAYQMTLLV